MTAISRGFAETWRWWSLARPASQALGLAGLFALFLNAAGTFDAGFTLTPSYLLLGLSVAVGFPGVVRGWQRLPTACQVAGCLLVGVYLIGVVFGSDLQLPSASARSSYRDLVYLVDVGLGLAVMGLLSDIAADPGGLRRAATWVCAGGLIAAAYALYQWPAQQFDWPFADVNNALNSDGYTSGHRFQGEGILGWERVRGTFKEPLFLASYLAVVLCLSAGLAVREHRLLGAPPAHRDGGGLPARAWTHRILTDLGRADPRGRGHRSPCRGELWTGPAGRGARGHSGGRPADRTAAVCRSGDPVPVDGSFWYCLAGHVRQPSEGVARGVGSISAQRPVLGHGPGQSSVRLAYRPDDGPGSDAPIVLGSAQGLWASALIDSGLIGLFAWGYLLTSVFASGGSRVASRPDALGLATIAASRFGGVAREPFGGSLRFTRLGRARPGRCAGVPAQPCRGPRRTRIDRRSLPAPPTTRSEAQRSERRRPGPPLRTGHPPVPALGRGDLRGAPQKSNRLVGDGVSQRVCLRLTRAARPQPHELRGA